MKKTLFGIGILLASLSMPTISSANNQNDFQQNPLEYPNDYYSMHSLVVYFSKNVKVVLQKLPHSRIWKTIMIIPLMLGKNLIRCLSLSTS